MTLNNDNAELTDDVTAELTSPDEVVEGEVVDPTEGPQDDDEQPETDEAEAPAPQGKQATKKEIAAQKRAAKAAEKEAAEKAKAELAKANEEPHATKSRAKQLTERLRKGVTNAVETYIEAYNERVWIALDYASWNDYLDGEFGDLRVKLPRGERVQLVGQMTEAKMSSRAIAAALGVDQKTVVTDRATLQGDDEAGEGSDVTGLDGRTRSSKGTSKPRKSYVDNVSDVITKLDSLAEDLRMLSVQAEWETDAGEIAGRHRSDLARIRDAVSGVLDRLQ